MERPPRHEIIEIEKTKKNGRAALLAVADSFCTLYMDIREMPIKYRPVLTMRYENALSQKAHLSPYSNNPKGLYYSVGHVATMTRKGLLVKGKSEAYDMSMDLRIFRQAKQWVEGPKFPSG